MLFFFPVSICAHEINQASSEVLLQSKAKQRWLQSSSKVIVKNSSPKNLSADRRPTGFARNIGYLSADSRPTVGNVSVTCR